MSRFVSAGAIDARSGEATAPAAVPANSAVPSASSGAEATQRKEEWETVQKELEEERKRREEGRRAAAEGGEPSLFAILQANKAAKQAAFEEANKIKNQFRALDDDEIEFLDGVQDSVRREEARVKRETQEEVERFREEQLRVQQRQGQGVDTEEPDEALGGEEWAVGAGRKRKRKEEKGGIRGVKRRGSVAEKEDADRVSGTRRTSSSTAAGDVTTPAAAASDSRATTAAPKEIPKTVVSPAVAAKPKMAGLVDYGSDDDDDDDDDDEVQD